MKVRFQRELHFTHRTWNSIVFNSSKYTWCFKRYAFFIEGFALLTQKNLFEVYQHPKQAIHGHNPMSLLEQPDAEVCYQDSCNYNTQFNWNTKKKLENTKLSDTYIHQ